MFLYYFFMKTWQLFFLQYYMCIKRGVFYGRKWKKQIIDEANETIDKVSDTLKVDGSKAKEYVNKMEESDLKLIRELKKIINMFKKPFWKVVFGLMFVCLIFYAFYLLGTTIGILIKNLAI